MKKIIDFLSMAFCIDGTAKTVHKFPQPDKDTPVFEMTDSKRGTFYVMMWKKDE